MDYSVRSTCQWSFIVLVTTLIACSRGSSVNLTIKGRDSLVGSFCPGIVQLFCKGVALTSLRWRYNGNMNIVPYFPDGSSNTQPSESAFFKTELIEVTRNPNNTMFADFSSYLSVNLSQLQSNNVRTISCGDPGVSQVEPVNVRVIEPGVPNNPTITMVTAAYQSGELSSVEVIWEKSDNFCSSYGLPIIYEVNVTGFDSATVNHSSCGEKFCTRSFNTSLLQETESTISIKAANDLGTSDTVLYPIVIAQQADQYFTPEVFPRGHQLFGRCTEASGFVGNIVCLVQHTTDSMYRNLSNEITAPLDSEFSILEDPVSNTTYYILFTVLVNGSLKVTDKIFFILETTDTDYRIAPIVVSVLIVCLVVVILTIIMFIVVRQIHSHTNNYVVELENMNSPVRTADESHAVKLSSSNPIKDEVSMENSRKDETFNGAHLGQESVANSSSNKDLIKSEELLSNQSLSSKPKQAQCDKISTEGSQKDQSPSEPKAVTNNEVDSPMSKKGACLLTSRGLVEIFVSSSEIRTEDQPLGGTRDTVYYKVVVKSSGQAYSVFRRYKQFKRLYNEVTRKYPSEASSLVLPNKAYLKNMYEALERTCNDQKEHKEIAYSEECSTNTELPTKSHLMETVNADTVKHRQAALNDLITELMKIPNILDFSPVLEFLSPENDLSDIAEHQHLVQS